MKAFRVLSVIAGLSGLGACATPMQVMDVQDVQTMVATSGSAFTKALFAGYRDAAKHEAEVEYEWRHASIFARKGIRAAAGEVVLPENPREWDVPATSLPELAAAHDKLMKHLADGARDRVPDKAAEAQLALDCWIEEEWESEPDSQCRDTFLKLEPQLAAPVAVAAEAAKAPGPFVVYFDYDKSDVKASEQEVLAQVAEAAAKYKPSAIKVYGHTDTMGGNPYNDKLSNKRAQTVAQQLSTLGVKAEAMDVKGFGKHQLAIQTANKVKEAKNRRVEIVFEGVQTSAAAPVPAPATLEQLNRAPAGQDGDAALSAANAAETAPVLATAPPAIQAPAVSEAAAAQVVEGEDLAAAPTAKLHSANGINGPNL